MLLPTRPGPPSGNLRISRGHLGLPRGPILIRFQTSPHLTLSFNPTWTQRTKKSHSRGDTHRDTVLLGKKLGCSVSKRSTSSQPTLTPRTCCLLSSLVLSAEQWQLSTIRSGQLLLLRLDSHSPTMRNTNAGALILDWDSSLSFFWGNLKGNKRTRMSGDVLQEHFTRSSVTSRLQNAIELRFQSHLLRPPQLETISG